MLTTKRHYNNCRSEGSIEIGKQIANGPINMTVLLHCLRVRGQEKSYINILISVIKIITNGINWARKKEMFKPCWQYAPNVIINGDDFSISSTGRLDRWYAAVNFIEIMNSAIIAIKATQTLMSNGFSKSLPSKSTWKDVRKKKNVLRVPTKHKHTHKQSLKCSRKTRRLLAQEQTRVRYWAIYRIVQSWSMGEYKWMRSGANTIVLIAKSI